MRAATGIIGLVLAALALCCGAGAATIDQALIDKAKQEGQVTFYTVDLYIQPMADAFQKKYGIKVNILRGDNADLILRLANEFRAGRTVADAVTLAIGIDSLIDGKVLRPFKLANGAELGDAYKDPNGYWVAVATYVEIPAVNTDLVASADRPKTYRDLLDPKWRGKIAWKPTDTTGAVGFIANILTTMGEEPGMNYLRELSGQNIETLNMSARGVTDRVIAGEYAIGLQVMHSHVEMSRNQGAPVDWLPLQPLSSNLDVIALTSQAPHPNAAVLFADFLVSQEGQTLYGKNYIPVRSDVPVETKMRLGAAGYKFNILSPEMISKEREHWTAVFDQLFR